MRQTIFWNRPLSTATDGLQNQKNALQALRSPGSSGIQSIYADKIIFKFTMNTTDNGSKDVKIYSDYKIDFKASLVLKPDIKFDL